MDHSYPVLTVLTFFPLLAALALAPAKSERRVRQITLAASLVELALAWPLTGFQAKSGFQFEEIAAWAPDWGLSYHLGIDGLSVLMIWLSVLTLPVCVLCSWTYIGRRVKEFHVCLLLMTTACVGVFSALDTVLFYVFWEALLIPMYLMIAIWGAEGRRYASIKFFLYTLAGSTLLLVAIVALRVAGGTFSIPELMDSRFSFRFQYWIFLAFFLAFAIKVPMFPFHTWLPAAHVQAPSAGSVILAAVLLKMGAYGFLRFSLPMAPAASVHFAPMMIAISAASIIYGGAVALGQGDIKKLVAYSSVAHMGFVTLGIFLFNSEGVNGAIFQMLNHGIITGSMFMMIGAVYERSHSREIAQNLGLGKHLPHYMFFWGLFGLASFGFPGTNGFVGEFMILAAAFKTSPFLGLAVIPGALLSAAYILKVTLKMAWGRPASPAGKGWADLKIKEWAYLVVPAVAVVWLGLAPGGVLGLIKPSVDDALFRFGARSASVGLMAVTGPDGANRGLIVVEDISASPAAASGPAPGAASGPASDPAPAGPAPGGARGLTYVPESEAATGAAPASEPPSNPAGHSPDRNPVPGPEPAATGPAEPPAAPASADAPVPAPALGPALDPAQDPADGQPLEVR